MPARAATIIVAATVITAVRRRQPRRRVARGNLMAPDTSQPCARSRSARPSGVVDDRDRCRHRAPSAFARPPPPSGVFGNGMPCVMIVLSRHDRAAGGQALRPARRCERGGRFPDHAGFMLPLAVAQGQRLSQHTPGISATAAGSMQARPPRCLHAGPRGAACRASSPQPWRRPAHRGRRLRRTQMAARAVRSKRCRRRRSRI